MKSESGLFRAFKYRNYRLFFFGQGTSFLGTMMQNTAQAWLIYRLTGSAAMLGLAAFAAQFPAFLVSPISGVLSDRMDRRRIILIADIFKILQAAALTVLAVTGLIRPWHVVALAAFLGVVNGIETTARHSMVPDIVDDRKDLANAIAVNSLLFNGGRVVGPAAAGFLVAYAGEGFCFGANALSYFALIYALLAMVLKPAPQNTRKTHPVDDIKEGYKYFITQPRLLNVVILTAFANLTGATVTVLMPVFAGNVLHGGPQSLGLLMGSIGAGAMAGALYLASNKDPKKLGFVITAASAVFGMGLCLLAVMPGLVPAMFAAAVTGAGMMLQSSASNTFVQTEADDRMRGRIMSFFVMAITGFGPIGNLLAGIAAKKFGVTPVLLAIGVFILVGAVLFGINIYGMRPKVKNHKPPEDGSAENGL